MLTVELRAFDQRFAIQRDDEFAARNLVRAVERAGNVAARGFRARVRRQRRQQRDGVWPGLVQRRAMEAFGEFFGDEACGQRSRAEALVVHDGGEEIDVVIDAFDAEFIER